MSVNIHPTAIVDQGAELGTDVIVGPYSMIGPKVKIGDGVKLKSNVVVEGRTSIGNHTVVHPFATLGTEPQDLKFAGEDTETIIGSHNKIREYVNINKGSEHGGGKTVIGDNNLIMVYSHIAHDCIIENNCIFANQATLAGHVTVGNHVVIGGVVAVHQFVAIGAHAMISGGSMLAQDVPPFCMAHGNRAKMVGLNVVGLKRQGFTGEKFTQIKSIYKNIYKDGLKLKEAIDVIQSDYPDGDIKKYFVDFLKKSDRGICRP